MSMLGDFLRDNNIQPEDVCAESQALERWSKTDRELVAKRFSARQEKKPYSELNIDKPSGLGRGLSGVTLARAIEGKKVPRAVRKKIVRAVNGLLVSKKKEQIEAKSLFSDTYKSPEPKQEEEGSNESTSE